MGRGVGIGSGLRLRIGSATRDNREATARAQQGKGADKAAARKIGRKHAKKAEKRAGISLSSAILKTGAENGWLS